MADLSYLKTLDKPLAILGLGVSGRAVAEACVESGIAFHAWDDKDETRTAHTQLSLQDFSDDLSGYAMLIPAAGIKPSHPILQKAKEQNIPIASDVDLLLRSAPKAKVIGITGTNGKSTTTALIGHILQANHLNVATGGNIGLAACSLPSLEAGIYVLELSSYQLEISADPIADVAIILNVTPNHLDWHGDFDQYVAAKRKILQPRGVMQDSIICVDSKVTEAIAQDMVRSVKNKLLIVSLIGDPSPISVTVKSGWLYDGMEKIADLTLHPALRGAHNHENIACAYAACRACGLSRGDILPAIMTFTNLIHRQQLVGRYGTVAFINDSKATNPAAAAKALAAFDNIYWIIGGHATTEGLNGLESYYPKIRHVFLIGAASDAFAKKLDGQLAYTQCGTLDKAVDAAFAMAQQDPIPATILLSPACQSYDQYSGYEERGAHFITLVADVLKQVSS